MAGARLSALAAIALSLLVATAFAIAGCAASTITRGSRGVRVAAAENFWGSIASQLGGAKTSVHSIIVDPAQDPHSYEPTASDARTLASAQLAIVNGVGYDPWAPKLLAANPTAGRLVLNVGELLRSKQGDNPHRWYDPAAVETVAETVTKDLQKLDPGHASYYSRQRLAFERSGLAPYRALIAQIKTRHAGVPIGASESIVAPLAAALGLRLITPAGFMNSTSEGTDVTAQDTARTERQITGRRIKLWVYNVQNATPEVQRLGQLARAARIPIASVTETLSPASYSFEQWQIAQLRGIETALDQGT